MIVDSVVNKVARTVDYPAKACSVVDMSLNRSDTHAPSSAAKDTLALLRDAMGDRVLPQSQRAIVSSAGASPEEGLALLGAYVAIADPVNRQAILDAVITMATPIVETARHRLRR